MTRFHSNFLTVVATLGTVVATVSAQGTNQRLTGSPSLETGAHVARIPVGSNLSSIRFEGVKTVLIPTQNKVSIDTRYCAEAAVRDPGGSMYCPAVEPETYVRVYQLTYSYEGQPLASDEFGNTHFTFNVYFRPEEIGPEAQKVLSQRHARPDAAELFELTTSTEWVARVAVDRDNLLYAVDAAAQVVQIFDDQGRVLMWFGEPKASKVGLELPAKVLVDYDHVGLFQKYAAPDFQVEHLVVVIHDRQQYLLCLLDDRDGSLVIQ